MTELRFIVDGCFRATWDDSFNWKPVAAFKYKHDAERFIAAQKLINAESAQVDRMEVRLRESDERGQK